jgi:hypothetical protein
MTDDDKTGTYPIDTMEVDEFESVDLSITAPDDEDSVESDFDDIVDAVQSYMVREMDHEITVRSVSDDSDDIDAPMKQATAGSMPSATTRDDYTSGDKRFTLIDAGGDAYEPDGFKVTDKSNSVWRVCIPERYIPSGMTGLSPSAAVNWEAVLTIDDETRTGYVMEAEKNYNKTYFTVSVDT